MFREFGQWPIPEFAMLPEAMQEQFWQCKSGKRQSLLEFTELLARKETETRLSYSRGELRRRRYHSEDSPRGC